MISMVVKFLDCMAQVKNSTPGVKECVGDVAEWWEVNFAGQVSTLRMRRDGQSRGARAFLMLRLNAVRIASAFLWRKVSAPLLAASPLRH